MPGYTIHMAVAKEYMKKHPGKIKNPEAFLQGVILPDMIQPKTGSHYGIDSSHPGLWPYLDTHDMSDEQNLGYFLHLLTDYYFYQKYLKNMEWSPDIYEDYNKLNQELKAQDWWMKDFVEGNWFQFISGGELQTRKVRWSKKQGLHINFCGYAVAYEDFN